MQQYDLAIIGSGPGGYVAAIRAGQLGLKTALIEKYNTLGGTCLNVGCIPSKALLDSSEHFHNAAKTFKTHGIEIDKLGIDFNQMIARKDKVVNDTCQGVSFLMKKNKVDTYVGVGSFIDSQTIQIKGAETTQEIKAAKTIIATGSKPIIIPGVEYDKKRVITSTEALKLPEVPATMAIIGGGVIGLELGSVYARLGTKVTVFEFMDRLIPIMDKAMGQELKKSLSKLGFKFQFKSKVKTARTEAEQVLMTVENAKGKVTEFKADYCLVAVGRGAYTEGLGLDKIGLKTDDRGRVMVDENLQTNVANIYAIGDVVKGAMLAHKAEEEGIFVVEQIAGQKPHINYKLIPNVVYTWPEVAGVGYTEAELIEEGRAYKTGKFMMRALGRARAAMDTDGLFKVLADNQTDEILGIHIIGARAADMIAEAVVAMEYRASAEDIARMSHAHPTFTEGLKEACLDATEKRALHA